MKQLTIPLVGEQEGYWFAFYDLPFAHHLALISLTTGWGPRIIQCGETENPTLEFIRLARAEIDTEEDRALSLEPNKHAAYLNLVMALSHSMEAIGYFGLSINELLERAREGDPKAFLKAVAIDSTVLATLIGSQVIAMAQARDDQPFLRGVQKAMKGPHIARSRYRDLRTMHRILGEVGALRRCTTNELLDLVGDRLGLYSTRDGDPLKALRDLFSTWTKESTR